MPKKQKRVLLALGWYDYRLHKGIERYAQKLLARTTQKIETIAHESGYQSINSFCVAFKSATGMSGKQFRDRMNRQNAA